jgi:hypothetical protein
MNNANHIVAVHRGDNMSTARCLNCGMELKLGLPITVDEWCAVMKGFVERHKDCVDRHGLEQPERKILNDS